MGKINLSRVFLDGIATGGFAVVVEYIAFVLGLTRKWDEVLVAAGALHHAQLAILALELFVGGPLAIWLYAAIRPRFGAGPRTAILAGVYIWFLMCPYLWTVLTIGGFLVVKLPLGTMVALNIASALLFIPGMLIGAWLYKEEASAGAG